MAAGRLLRIREVAVDLDLEDAAPRGDQRDVRQVLLEFFEDPLRQTDGSRTVPSLSAILDRDTHDCSLVSLQVTPDCAWGLYGLGDLLDASMMKANEGGFE